MAKISIKIASKGNNNFDLSSNHITTTDFGQIQVSNFLPVIPNDKIKCSLFSEARFAPLVVPTFMDVKLITRAFYVPMSAIYQPFEYFYTDKQDSSVFKTLPTCTNASLASFFTNSANGLTYHAGDGMAYDFQFVAGGVTYNYILTEKGRLFLKLVQSLGYSINWAAADTTSFSLLPLLAFARVCYDYVYPSQYLDGLGLTAYFKIASSSDYSNLLGNATKQQDFFNIICGLLTLPYKQDYFTASWKELNAPGSSVQNISLNSPSSFNEIIKSTQNEVETDNNGSNFNTRLSQYSLNILSRLYDFVTRNNIVGTRYSDQLFARFGIGSRKSDPDMSQFIGQHIQPINVIDVTAMSAGQGQELGELAGKAYLQGKGNLFTFDSVDEFGYILSLSFVMPEIGYYQGRKRWTTQFGRFDFVHPEFDMQMRAVRNDELFADFMSPTDYSNGLSYGGTPNNRFSFAPNYSEFKKGDDYLTGDFRVPSLSRNLNSYHLMRDLATPSSRNPLAMNAQFLFCQQHQFDKIFAQMYTLRVPISWSESTEGLIGYSGTHTLLVNGKVLLIKFTQGSTDYYLQIYGDGATVPECDVNYTRAFSYTSLPSGMTEDDYFIVNGTLSTSLKFTLFGRSWLFSYSSGNFDGSFSVDQTTPIWTHDIQEFFLVYQDYIDHIYLRHRFDIKASRSLQPISEEFMIEDGGAKVNVAMNGNRIV